MTATTKTKPDVRSATDPTTVAAQIQALEAQAARHASTAAGIHDPAHAATQVNEERAAKLCLEQAADLRVQLEQALAVQAQAALSAAADNTIATLATKEAAVTSALSAAKTAISTVASVTRDRDVTATTQASVLAGHLSGTCDTPRVTAGRAGTTVDGKPLGPIGPAVFVELSLALAALADQVGASGYGDALRNTARVLPRLHTPFAS